MKSSLSLGLAFLCVIATTRLATAQQAPSAPPAPPAAQPQQQAPDPEVQQGNALDLQGKYDEARTHFKRAIASAASPEAAARATRALAVSYAFESNCKEAAAVEGPLYDKAVAARAFNDAGELANELARICLESGDAAQAEAWYRKGFDAGKQDTSNQNGGPELWTFRWEHAQARIAARRGQKAEAATHVAAAKAVLDSGKLPQQQAAFFPYLTGYVAFYAGDYAKAAADLQQANQNDVFIMSLLAQSYEKTGDAAKARALYQKIMDATNHNPPMAFARPTARARLAAQ
jgi:tetratricopeptide (TPR) repeat protein